MKAASIVTVIAATLVGIGTALWLHAHDGDGPRVPYPKATPPPAPSPVFTPASDPAPSAADIEREAREHVDRLVLDVERLLAAGDTLSRETAFTFLLPELIQTSPERVVALVAQQPPGEARDILRDEVARQWITRDRDAAVRWMKAFENPAETRRSANVAVRALAVVAPEQAIEVADQFGIGRDDGYLERMVQLWAQDDLHEASRWLDTQPEGPGKDQLRARVDLVREQRKAPG